MTITIELANRLSNNRHLELCRDVAGRISNHLTLQDVIALRAAVPTWRAALDDALSQRLRHIAPEAPEVFEHGVRAAEQAAQSAEARTARARAWGKTGAGQSLFITLGASVATASVVGICLGALILPSLASAHACALAGCSNGAWQSNAYAGGTSEANCISAYSAGGLISGNNLDPCVARDGGKVLAGVLVSAFGGVLAMFVGGMVGSAKAPALSAAFVGVGNKWMAFKNRGVGDAAAPVRAAEVTVEARLQAAKKLTEHLVDAVTAGDTVAIDQLLRLGAPTFLLDSADKSPVTAAIEGGNAGILAMLLRGDHRPTAQELGIAVKQENRAAMRALLDKSGRGAAALINSTIPSFGGTPFHLSVYARDTQVFSLLADRGGDLGRLNEDGASVQVLARARLELRPVLDALPHSTVIEIAPEPTAGRGE